MFRHRILQWRMYCIVPVLWVPQPTRVAVNVAWDIDLAECGAIVQQELAEVSRAIILSNLTELVDRLEVIKNNLQEIHVSTRSLQESSNSLARSKSCATVIRDQCDGQVTCVGWYTGTAQGGSNAFLLFRFPLLSLSRLFFPILPLPPLPITLFLWHSFLPLLHSSFLLSLL